MQCFLAVLLHPLDMCEEPLKGIYSLHINVVLIYKDLRYVDVLSTLREKIFTETIP